MNEQSKSHTIFLSYSHDSTEHKRWVGELATRLLANGINVILDQWDLRLGDDVPKFMEKAVKEADRVLLVCTEKYVRKANDGVGGVGYEAMIVTGELIRHLGSAKFIPVVRQESDPPVLPTSLSTRFYVNLSKQEHFDSEFERLVRELHQAPLIPKPPLGKNPFLPAEETSIGSGEKKLRIDTASQVSVDGTPEELYERARAIALRGDISAWRSLVRLGRNSANSALAQWWSRYGSLAPKEQKALVSESFDGLKAFEPLMVMALAAVTTGREAFRNQVALFEEIVLPTGWRYGGYEVRVELPHAGGFVYQALHGALCLHVSQLATAIRLAREQIKLASLADPLPIFQIPDFIGWPNSLGRDSRESWQVLVSLPERWPWVIHVFGSAEEFLRAMVAYYMGLSVNEFATHIAHDHARSFEDSSRMRIGTPTHFAATSDETRRAAFRLLTVDACAVCDIWRSLKVTDEQAKNAWGPWLNLGSYWHQRLYPSLRTPFGYEKGLIEYTTTNCQR